MILPALLAIVNQGVTTVTIDTTKSTPISPYIYGVNSPENANLGFSVPLARLGGNRMTAYNWETNASNAGNDYRYQNDNYMGSKDPAKANEPGWTERTFMEAAQSHGAAALLTVPTAGYVSADKNEDGDVRKTPDHLAKRFVKSLPRKPGSFQYPPDLKDQLVYQDEFVAWIEHKKSRRTPVWYMLDNEPDLWGSTHNEIWEKNPTYAQIISNNIEYAAAIKRVAPHALIFGPANYGWNGFRTFQNAPDGKGRDFLDVYLASLAKSGKGRRLLDVLDVHWYPEAQGGGKRITEDGNAETAAARIQAPRSLWDPTYIEDSWISKSIGKKPIQLLPGLFKQIADKYPGTKLSLSEYNFGGNNDISGAIAQADVLGIFGRYGLFAACNWGISPKDKAQVAGFKAFRNYDLKGATFNDQSLPVAGVPADRASVYASLGDPMWPEVTVVAINKTDHPMPMKFALGQFVPSEATAYTYTKENITTNAWIHLAKRTEHAVEIDLPGMSVTTLSIRTHARYHHRMAK